MALFSINRLWPSSLNVFTIDESVTRPLRGCNVMMKITFTLGDLVSTGYKPIILLNKALLIGMYFLQVFKKYYAVMLYHIANMHCSKYVMIDLFYSMKITFKTY